MAELIKPKIVTITDLDGVERVYTIGRFPATIGREIVTQYPVTAAPKIGDYKSNAALSEKMMAFVEVKPAQGDPIRLVTTALVDNHVPDAETLLRLEWELMGHNTSFFGAGKSLNFFSGFQKILTPFLMKMLTGLSEALSQAARQRSTNSEQSMT